MGIRVEDGRAGRRDRRWIECKFASKSGSVILPLRPERRTVGWAPEPELQPPARGPDLLAKGLAKVAHFSARSIQVSIAGCRATPATIERLIAEPLFLGIDVSKSWIDIADTRGRALRVANEETAIAAAFKNPWSSCAGMVCEATGGYGAHADARGE